MLAVFVLIAAVVVTATAAVQVAGRLGAFGYGMLELGARHASARNGNIVLAVALWALWFYLRS